MDLLVIILPALTFILCLFIHAALWRLKFPANRASALLLIFVVLPFVSGATYAFFAAGGALPSPGFETSEWCAAFELQAAFASAYILTYPAFEALSPSLVIVLLVGDSGSVTKGELSGRFSDEALFAPRIKDLLSSGFVKERSGVLSITARGRALALFFTLMRAFLGLPKGGG